MRWLYTSNLGYYCVDAYSNVLLPRPHQAKVKTWNLVCCSLSPLSMRLSVNMPNDRTSSLKISFMEALKWSWDDYQKPPLKYDQTTRFVRNPNNRKICTSRDRDFCRICDPQPAKRLNLANKYLFFGWSLIHVCLDLASTLIWGERVD